MSTTSAAAQVAGTPSATTVEVGDVDLARESTSLGDRVWLDGAHRPRRQSSSV
jgi:hypothetical protein